MLAQCIACKGCVGGGRERDVNDCNLSSQCFTLHPCAPAAFRPPPPNHTDGAHAGCAGGVPQPAWLPVHAPGRVHQARGATGVGEGGQEQLLLVMLQTGS
jgi:hypothetical protein